MSAAGWRCAKPSRRTANLARLLVRDENGPWTLPLLTQILSEASVGYRLISNQSIHPTRVRNLAYLRRYERLDLQPLPSEAVSPRAKCEQATREHGSLLGRLGSLALIHTSMNSSLDTRKLKYRDGSAGSRIDGFSYDFAGPLAGLNGQVCHVHADPRDARRAHVFVRGCWHELRCRVLEQRWREVPKQRIWAFTQELRDMRRPGRIARKSGAAF